MTALYGWVISLILVAGIGGAAYWYYTSTQETILQLTSDNKILVEAIKESEHTVKALIEDLARNEVLARDLTIRMEQAEGYQDILVGKLQKHDFTNLVTRKPGLMETVINEGTKNLFEDLERTTAK